MSITSEIANLTQETKDILKQQFIDEFKLRNAQLKRERRATQSVQCICGKRLLQESMKHHVTTGYHKKNCTPELRKRNYEIKQMFKQGILFKSK